jgi:hypothetical protein
VRVAGQTTVTKISTDIAISYCLTSAEFWREAALRAGFISPSELSREREGLEADTKESSLSLSSSGSLAATTAASACPRKRWMMRSCGEVASR